MLPKWSGEPGETELFVQQVADRIGGEKGDILYFQVAEYVLCGCQNNPNLSWDRIKRGFEASEKQNGTSMLNLNRIAYLATYYGKHDPIYADKILKRIGDQWDDDTWANEEAFKKVKRWAADIAPAAEQERTLEVSAEANEHTPEGARYKIAFEKAFREMLQQCVKTDGGSVAQWGGEFETLVDLSAKGEVENLQIQSNGPVVMCVYKTLGKLRQAGTTPFPPPPQPSYWLKLSMDWAEFAPEEIK